MSGVYVHVPFCGARCAYCDFVSFTGRKGDMSRYVGAVLREMRERAGADGFFDTLYFGGGTPSLLTPEDVRRLVECSREYFGLVADAEVTIEANPATFDAGKAEAWREAGVSRVSLGAQASQDVLLKALGRIHAWRDVEAGMDTLRRAGFYNVSLDLMYGLPGQTPKHWRETLARAVELGPAHLSCYALKLEDGTGLARRVDAGECILPDEDSVIEMMDDAEHIFATAGYGRYEISNWARPGRESRHNLNYWLNGGYVGLGVAAHGRIGRRRYWNTASLVDYMEHGSLSEYAEIDDQEERFETAMLALRLAQGLSLEDYQVRTGEIFFAGRGDRAKKLHALGLLDWNGVRVWVTPAGMRVHNAVLAELL